MAKPIEIYDIQFNSQKAAENHTQELLSRYNYCAIIEGNDFGFFCCLLGPFVLPRESLWSVLGLR